MELKFTSIEEMQEFMKRLKGTRGGKAGDKDDGETSLTTGQLGPGSAGAPPPLMPGPNGGAPGGFGGPQPGFNPQGMGMPGAGFPGATVPGVDPAMAALVARVAAKIDWAVAPPPQGAGQAVEQTLAWFRGQCGLEAANATLDQIKQVFLFKMPAPQLEQIAKMMNA